MVSSFCLLCSSFALLSRSRYKMSLIRFYVLTQSNYKRSKERKMEELISDFGYFLAIFGTSTSSNEPLCLSRKGRFVFFCSSFPDAFFNLSLPQRCFSH